MDNVSGIRSGLWQTRNHQTRGEHTQYFYDEGIETWEKRGQIEHQLEAER